MSIQQGRTQGRLIRCPVCGHRQRLSEEPPDNQVTCAVCQEVLRVPTRQAPVESQLSGKKPEPWGRRLIKKTLGDPAAALEGAIPGALSGVLAGVGAAVMAAMRSGEGGGDVVGGILTGFVVGFAAGTFSGAVLGAAARRLDPDFHVRPGPVLLTGGAMVGGLIGLIVGGLPGMVVGVALGALGAYQWGRLCRRVESAEQSPRPFSVEKDDLLGPV